MNPLKLRIGEAAELLGITAKTIRHYHAIGLLPEPQRHNNGYRLYTPADLRQIQHIRRLQGYGLTLRQIHFILYSDEPDADLQRFLLQRDAELGAQIAQLQRQQIRIRAAIEGTETSPSPTLSTRAVIDATLRPIVNELTDVLLNVEAAVFDDLDSYPHAAAHADFWEAAIQEMIPRLLLYEHSLILWLERYLTLADMTLEDRQAQAWLSQLSTSSDASILGSMLNLPRLPLLPPGEQAHLQQMFSLLLYDHATPLQRAFLATLHNRQY